MDTIIGQRNYEKVVSLLSNPETALNIAEQILGRELDLKNQFEFSIATTLKNRTLSGKDKLTILKLMSSIEDAEKKVKELKQEVEALKKK